MLQLTVPSNFLLSSYFQLTLALISGPKIFMTDSDSSSLFKLTDGHSSLACREKSTLDRYLSTFDYHAGLDFCPSSLSAHSPVQNCSKRQSFGISPCLISAQPGTLVSGMRLAPQPSYIFLVTSVP